MSAVILGLRSRVVRIEAIAQVEEVPNEVKWELYALEPQHPDSDIVNMVGHMTVGANGNWGQVVVLGDLKVVPGALIGSTVIDFLNVHARGFADELYTTARRALNVNAVLLDIDFGLQVDPPVINWADMKILPPLPIE